MGCLEMEYEGDEMKRAKYLYHVTKPENVPKIIAEGLRRERCAVYLSTKPLSWYKDGLAILKVDISGLGDIKANTFLPELDEVLFWDDIPAWKLTKKGYIRRITDVTDKYVGGKKEEGAE